MAQTATLALQLDTEQTAKLHALYRHLSRELDPRKSAVVTVGTFHAGLKENIIPASAEFTLNIRTFEEDVRGQVLAAVRRIIEAESAASGARQPEIEEMYGAISTASDPSAPLKASMTGGTASGSLKHCGKRGPVAAMADSLRVTVHGRQSHGSQPQDSIDPIVLAAHMVTRLQGIVQVTGRRQSTTASPRIHCPHKCDGPRSKFRC